MFNAEKYDTQKFKEGVWKTIMGGRFLIARAGNAEYEQALEDSGYRKIEDPAEKQQALYRAIGTGILKSWDQDPKSETRVADRKGEAIPYSADNVVRVLMDNPDLVGKVLNEANDLSNWKRKDVADQAKKPEPSSAGKAASSE